MEKNGKCLSKSYKGNDEPIYWQCSEGHKWKATPHNIRKGTWCPICAGNLLLSIEEMQKIAKERGGRCLSQTYKKAHGKLLWECSKGHQWEATPAMIRNGTWCPVCAGTIRLTIEEMQKIAEKRGGRCISPIYEGGHSKILWECSEGHQWESTPASVKCGTWCPVCAGNVKLSVEEMQKLAEERGGRCLSHVYKNSNSKLLWECSKGHQWEATPANTKKGRWCPKCGIESSSAKRRSSIEEMQKLAEERGGRCLSPAYKGGHLKLLWECSKGISGKLHQ